MPEERDLKKKIIVVAGIEDHLRQEYWNQLETMLGDLAEIREYAIGKDQGMIQGDEAIALTHAAGAIVKQLAGRLPVTLLRTTFTRAALDRLRRIPEGTDVLLISYEWTYLAECIELLRRLGIRHINFIPYYKGMEEEQSVQGVAVGVYMGHLYVKPPFIKELIDVGWRQITPESYLEMMGCVGIGSQPAEEKLTRLREALPKEGADIGMIMSDFSAVSRLQRILDAVPMGILIIDGRGCVEAYNNFICRVFHISMTEMMGRSVKENPGISQLYEHIEGTKLEKNLYYTDSSLKKEYIIRRKNVYFMEKKYQDIILMEEVPEGDGKGEAGAVLTGKLPGACYTFEQIVGSSPAMKQAVDYAKRYASTDLSVLILGETGTGKELFAHAIHNASSRKNRPFISLNCAAIPKELLESELFGYEKGSFTGARTEGKKGLFELANGGTIFLDEIGDAGELFQVKLLRVLQEKEITKVGGYLRIPLDVRIVAATNKPIDDVEQCLGFRKDLFYRLSSCILSIPPLRQRRGDILLLTEYYLESMGAGEKRLDEPLERFLFHYTWGGNVRELKNCVEYMGYFGERVLTSKDLPMMYQSAYEAVAGGQTWSPPPQPTQPEACGNDARLELLRLVAQKSSGRRQLTAALCRQGMRCSEYEVRCLMDDLERQGYLKKGIGRSGSFLTERGMLLLQQE